MTPEQVKLASHGALARFGININDALPLLEAPSELHPQSPASVARRAIVLTYIVGAGYGRPGPELRIPLTEYGLLVDLSASEADLLDNKTPSVQDKADAAWVVECLQAIGWCLGLTGLDPFSGCDDDLADRFPAPRSDPSTFIQSASLRPFSEIYGQADLYYRLHWAARDAALKSQSRDVLLHERTIRERRKALDWIVGVESDWDDVPLDT